MDKDEFKAITTQEAFDAAIKERIKREKEAYTAEQAELKEANSNLKKQLEELQKTLEEETKKSSTSTKTISDLTSQVNGYKLAALKARIAHEKGIPYELAERLHGDTEEDLQKDADILQSVIGSQAKSAPPLKSTEPKGLTSGSSQIDGAYAELARNLSKGE